MGRQAGLFDIEERLRELSAKGDDLELTRSEFDILADLLAAGRRVRGVSRV